jgi:hypothetical protein
MRIASLSVLCLALAPALGACSIALDGTSGVFSAQPGKYDFLDCPSIATHSRNNAARETELTGLMERAKRDAFGPVVNTLVYQDELNQVRANQHALMKAADEKRCTPDVIKPTATSLAPVH